MAVVRRPPARAADHRRDPPGGAIDRHQLRISAHHRADRIEPQPVGAGLDLLGEGPLSVHRADLARHHEATPGLRSACPLCRRHHRRVRTAAMTCRIRRRARRSCGCAPIRTVSATMAGAFTRTNATQLCRDRPRAERGRTLHRAFPRTGRRRQADCRVVEPAPCQCGRHVSGGRCRQPQYLLRHRRRREVYRCRAHGARSYTQADRPLRTSPVRSPFAPSGRDGGPATYRPIRAVAQAYAPTSPRTHARRRRVPADSRPLFQAMFTDRPQGGVSQTVNTLWGAAKAEAQAADRAGAAARSVHRRAAAIAQVDRRQGLRRENVVNARSISMVNALLSLLGIG